MQIQLRQPEIKDALKQYITKQGINLQGKVVSIDFTAGRKETGLSADISIEDAGDIPGLDDTPEAVVGVNDTAAPKPALVVVTSPKVEAQSDTPAPPTVDDTPATPVKEAKTATSSLFS